MNRIWVWGVVVSIAVMSTGCVSLDKYQALERSHRLLNERLSQVQDDLQNAELQNQQKDTQIAALKDQVDTKDKTINSLQAEAEGLRNSLAKAEEILKKMAGTASTTTIINSSPLPKDVNAALKELARQYPDFIEYDEAKGAVRWKADLLFPLGSDELTTSPEMLEALGKFVEIINMASAAKLDVIVVGHTCNTPIRKAATLARFKDNWYLSAGRAIVVMQMFASKGVAFTRMGVMGYGEYRPIADNATTEGKAKNRRVEVYLVPHEAVQSVGGTPGIYGVKDSNLNFAKEEMGKDAAETAAPAPKAEKPAARTAPKKPAPAREAEPK
jgi:chemotaxis protein MotB